MVKAQPPVQPQPMVVVSCDAIDYRLLTWSAAPSVYMDALAREGLLPVQLPALAPAVDPAPLLDVVDGVLLTGARANVHPTLYGAAPSPAAEPYDEVRDATTLPLIRAAVYRGLPLLAICRGHQELNVAFGGTLTPAVHDLPGRFDHRSEPEPDLVKWFAHKHEVTVSEGGLLASILGAGPVDVNSVHHQAVDRLGPGLFAEALAPDGTVEAVSVPSAKAFALGLQWHPEHLVGRDDAADAIFAAFAQAVAGRAASRQPARAA